MSRDNVKEMARVMCGRDKDCLLCPIQSPCLMRNCAELLNAEGYRKSADVAREIFEEINMPRIGVDKYKENPMERLFHLLYFKVLMLAKDGLKGRTHNEISFNKYSA